MALAIYVLCFLTASICAAMLLRGYRRTGVRLLLWSGICFLCLAVNNAALFADRVLFPDVDLYVIRTVPTLLGLCALLYGLIWEAE